MPTPDDQHRIDSNHDETPHTPAVLDIGRHAPEDISPSSARGVKKTIAILAFGVSTLIAHTIEKYGPKTPRPPHVTEKKSSPGNRGDENCGRDPLYMYPDPETVYGIDGEVVKGPPAEPSECQFETLDDGSKVVTGHETVEGDQKRVCFFTPVWAPDAAVRLAGKIRHDEQFPGVIDLENGMIDITNGIIEGAPKIEKLREVKVAGEASLAVASEGRVTVAILPQEFDEAGKPTMAHVLVSAQEGRAIVKQVGRGEDIIVEECEDYKIPIDVAHLNGGCYIAEGEPGAGGFDAQGGEIILLAGAVFLGLRRRASKKENV